MSYNKIAQKKWRKKNPKKVTIINERWRQKNLGKVHQLYQQRYQEQKDILHNLKINGCAICGYNRCDAALNFHHVNPEDKKFQIITIHISRKNLVEELNKCILLCANCHKEKHI